MSTAPQNATWCEVKLQDGTLKRAHWASNLSGEEQPPFQGWFEGEKTCWQIAEPVEWRPPGPLEWMPADRVHTVRPTHWFGTFWLRLADGGIVCGLHFDSEEFHRRAQSNTDVETGWYRVGNVEPGQQLEAPVEIAQITQ